MAENTICKELIDFLLEIDARRVTEAIYRSIFSKRHGGFNQKGLTCPKFMEHLRHKVPPCTSYHRAISDERN